MRLLWISLIGGGLLLASCAPTFGEAVTQQGLLDQASQALTMGGTLQATSQPQMHATTPAPGGTVALVTYDAEHNHAPARVLAVHYVKRVGLGWADGGGGFDLSAANVPLAPLEFVSGQSDPAGAFSYAGGLVHDPAITQVALTVHVDDTQPPKRVIVPVHEGAYIVVVDGALQVSPLVEGLDSTGRVVHDRRQ